MAGTADGIQEKSRNPGGGRRGADWFREAHSGQFPDQEVTNTGGFGFAGFARQRQGRLTACSRAPAGWASRVELRVVVAAGSVCQGCPANRGRLAGSSSGPATEHAARSDGATSRSVDSCPTRRSIQGSPGKPDHGGSP